MHRVELLRRAANLRNPVSAAVASKENSPAVTHGPTGIRVWKMDRTQVSQGSAILQRPIRTTIDSFEDGTTIPNHPSYAANRKKTIDSGSNWALQNSGTLRN